MHQHTTLRAFVLADDVFTLISRIAKEIFPLTAYSL